MAAESDHPTVTQLRNLARAGRQAMAARDWRTVEDCAQGILRRHADDPEGHFLLGIAAKAAKQPRRAIEAFETVLRMAPARYDAGIELASQFSMARRNGEVADLLERFTPALDNSPRYLDLAGTVYTEIGLPEKAWPLYGKACELQPEITLFQANRAACAVYVGEIETAKEIYRRLLAANPTHQRNHYQLSRVARAEDLQHIRQMEQVLGDTNQPPERNIFIYYAIGKEYEDLHEWDRAFDYFKRAGDAVSSVANYDVADDIAIIDTVIEHCNADWLLQCPAPANVQTRRRCSSWACRAPVLR